MNELIDILKKHQPFHLVVPFNAAKDKIIGLDLTDNNKELTDEIVNDTELFTQYSNNKLKSAGAKYIVGGYNEHRTIYSRSKVFDEAAIPPPLGEIEGVEPEVAEPRRLHIGIDIWGPAGTPVYAPLEATIHSFAFNDAFGDYGATLILQHDLEGFIFHTLYGHLSLRSIQDVQEGQLIEKGQWIAAFGDPKENGHWTPHLHFQIIIDMQGWKGDYPGVCKFSEREDYLKNCPDADLILQMMTYIK